MAVAVGLGCADNARKGELFTKPINGQNKYFTLAHEPLLSFDHLYEFNSLNSHSELVEWNKDES